MTHANNHVRDQQHILCSHGSSLTLTILDPPCGTEEPPDNVCWPMGTITIADPTNPNS